MKNRNCECSSLRKLTKHGCCILILTISSMLFLTACMGGTSVYLPPGETTQLGADFSDSDFRMLAQKMYNSLQMKLETMPIKPDSVPVIALLRIGNRTSEHIDANMISDKLQIELLRAGSIRFVDRNKIQDMIDEFDLGSTELVDSESFKKAGKILGADYFLYGELGSIKKQDGKSQLNYYRLSMKLLDIETNEIVWADDGEIKKLSRKPAISW